MFVAEWREPVTSGSHGDITYMNNLSDGMRTDCDPQSLQSDAHFSDIFHKFIFCHQGRRELSSLSRGKNRHLNTRYAIRRSSVGAKQKHVHQRRYTCSYVVYWEFATFMSAARCVAKSIISEKLQEPGRRLVWKLLQGNTVKGRTANLPYSAFLFYKYGQPMFLVKMVFNPQLSP